MTPKINALLDQINSGKLVTDQARILDYIQQNPFCTIREIEKELHLIHETASARVSGLQDLGLVETKDDGKYSQLLYQPNPQAQKVNAFLRKEEKFKRWKKKATEFSDILDPKALNFIKYLNPQTVNS